MSSSFKDQLLGLGFKNSSKPVNPPTQKSAVKTPMQKHNGPHRKTREQQRIQPEKSSEIDLAKAFALRQHDERRIREQAEHEKQEQARIRKIAKENVAALLKDTVLNNADANIARHFPYAGKIKRIYVTAGQLIALNAGELAVVQQAGKFCLVETAIALQIKALIPALLALHCDGTEQNNNDDYIEPQFQVPDDLIW
jgi:uncharacterized protein YaiL (DUF2058 family)